MWLPTWIGLSKQTLETVERNLQPKVAGIPATEERLDEINELVIETLSEMHPQIQGLRDYLDGMKFVQI